MHEMAGETFLFAEEIQGLMTENLVPSVAPPIDTGSSFTALLGLPANQAVEVLLHEPESKKSSVIPVAEIWNDRVNDEETLGYSFKCSPTFPTNAALIERAAKFSIFAFGENSPESSSVPSNSTENSLKLKNERTDSESNPTSSQIFSVVPKNQNEKQRSTKRKERGEKKVKCCGTAKKCKNVENGSSKIGGEINKDEEKLPYFHVRARRGQATDSHSLAERARREKINARMKLLQELVPGCSKISGTALVLDEIINHVQALQRQVEFLSMRLSAVIPRIDFNLDSLLVAESGYLFSGNSPNTLTVEPSMWPEFQLNGATRHRHQNQYPQLLEVDGPQAPITPENLLFGYDSSPCSVSLRSSQLKMEL